MKNCSLKISFLFIGLFVLVSLACGMTSQVDPTATTQPPVQIEEPVVVQEVTEPPVVEPEIVLPEPTDPPTQEIPPTETVTPTEEVVDEGPPAYFTEEFDGDISSWSYFLMSGDENKMDLSQSGGYLVFDLQGEDIYAYIMYDKFIYSDVRIELKAENRAKNKNDVSLLCNYSERFGWYEFTIGNDGLYSIWVYSQLDGGYIKMANGGSTNINMGRDTNVYAAVCSGNQLKLYINGILEREYIDNKYNLREGHVGLGVSSHNVLPILVEIDYVSISVP